MAGAAIDSRDRHALERTLEELRSMHGSALQAVALYGEAATEAYRPRRSPLLLVVVLDSVTTAALRATAGSVARWRRRRIGAPLLFDPPYIATAHDVFPLEFLDLADRHRVLLGQDPFAGLTINLDSLRAEIEVQLRGKMLHLYQAYLESGGSRSNLEPLLTQSAEAFDVIMRGVLCLREAERPAAGAALLAAVERTFGLSLPALTELADYRAEARRIPRSRVEPLFEAYLDEVRALVGVIDGL